MSKMKEMTDNKYQILISYVIKIIKHRSLMQTEKSQPSGQRVMPETGYTSFPAFSVYTLVGISRFYDRFYLSYMETVAYRCTMVSRHIGVDQTS